MNSQHEVQILQEVVRHEVGHGAQPHLVEITIHHQPIEDPPHHEHQQLQNQQQQNQQHQNQQQQHQQLQHQPQQPVLLNLTEIGNNTQEQPSSPTDKKSSNKNDKKKKEAIDKQAREIIFKVIKFFESEKLNRGYAFPVENVVKRACAATGLSESTIKRIKRDGLRAEATQTRMTGPKKKRVRKTKVQLDYFQLCALRGIVNSYSLRKEVPTLGKILAAAKSELNYTGGKESLRLILLNKLGIKFKKCEKKNVIKKPPDEQILPPPMPHNNVMQNVMPPQQQQQVQVMTHMKLMDNQCVYTNMIPPVSY